MDHQNNTGTEAPEPGESVPVEVAARRLGISTEAVRKRIQRGTLRGHKLPPPEDRWVVAVGDLPPERPMTENSPDSQQQLIAAYERQIAFLQEELDRRDRILERRDFELAHRTDEIRRLQEAILEQARGLNQIIDRTLPALPEPRSWWRRIFPPKPPTQII